MLMINIIDGIPSISISIKNIILPFTVLRRLDAILEPTKDKVLEIHEKLNEMKIDNQSPQLRKTSGYVFYNTSNYTFKRLFIFFLVQSVLPSFTIIISHRSKPNNKLRKTF